MAIDKLNFSGINSGSESLVSPMGSLSDRLMKYGSILNQNALDEQKQKRLDEQEAYQKQRDNITDSRYESDKKERLDDKNRLLQKDYNTANAMSAIENKDAYIAGRMSSEQKAIQDTMASATPEERLQMQQELKGYDPKASGQQWANTALSQSNVDSKDITNLKRDIAKEAEQTRQFNENKRIAQENFNKTYNLQKLQYDQTSQERVDRLLEKKDAKAGQLAYVNGLNTNVDNSTKVLRDSKTGEKYIPDENLNAHKEAFNEFGQKKDIQELTSRLKTAQENGSKLYTDEQLADPVFMKKLYNESTAGQKSQGSGLLKNVLPESLFPNREMLRDVKAASFDIQKYKAIKSDPKSTGADIAFADEKLLEIEKNISGIKNKYTNKDSNTNFLTFEDFSTNTKATNKTKKDELVTLQNQLDSAYKAQDIELKNKFGKIKQDEIVIPKTEDEYAQDLYNANTAGKTLSVDEKVGFMKSSKEKAATHQKKVEKDESDALKVRLNQMEKATEAQKLEYNTYDDQIKTLNDQISKITTGNASKEDLYSRVTSKEVKPETAITELKTEIEQLKTLQKGLANKIKN